MPKRWCLDCHQLYDREATGTQRCPTCQAMATQSAAATRARAAAGRPSASARGYGSVYRRRAAAIVRHALEVGEACGICGQPCLPGQVIHAHHPDGRPALADEATCALVPAHASCNTAAAAAARAQ